MGYIYSLDFPNGKQYIGMTSQTVAKRMATHRMCSKRGDAALYRAWRKHGDPKVNTLAVIEEHMLRETERKAIAVLNSMVPNGYNLVAGGEGGGVSEETSKKISLAHMGRPKSEEHRRNISIGQLGRVGTWLGKKHSLEHIAKRAAAHRGRKRNPEFCALMSELGKRRVVSEETKRKTSESMKAARKARPWSTRKY